MANEAIGLDVEDALWNNEDVGSTTFGVEGLGVNLTEAAECGKGENSFLLSLVFAMVVMVFGGVLADGVTIGVSATVAMVDLDIKTIGLYVGEIFAMEAAEVSKLTLEIKYPFQ